MAGDICKKAKENIKDLYKELQKVKEKISHVRDPNDCEQLIQSLDNIDQASAFMKSEFYEDYATKFIEKTIDLSKNFYDENNLGMFMDFVRDSYFIDYENYERICRKFKEGFKLGLYIPSIDEICKNRHMHNVNLIYHVIGNMLTPIDGLHPNDQYMNQNLDMSKKVKSQFPDQLSRRMDDMPYIIMYKEEPESPENTKKESVNDILSKLKQKGENGMNLMEYLFFQRIYVKKNKNNVSYAHPDQDVFCVLAESFVPERLIALWNTVNHQIRLRCISADNSFQGNGVRECVVIPLGIRE